MAQESQPSVERTLWQFLALPDEDLEKADLVELNLAVAREIPAFHDIDVSRYWQIVTQWSQQFAQRLPELERMFKKTPWKWKSDMRFFRVGMLRGFLGHTIGLRYIEEQKDATQVQYTDPGHLFLNGLIDKKQGTCGNMPTLHVAICRRLGWPVSLACAKSHLVSRFDDGQVIYNIEATSTHAGSFCAEEDSFYVKKYHLPKRAIDCGSDLRKLTAREMIGVFLGLRARHYGDVDNPLDADTSFALSRVLFPNHRRSYIGAMVPMLRRGTILFDPDELGHPNSLFQELAPKFAPAVCSSFNGGPSPMMQYVTTAPVHRPTCVAIPPVGVPPEIQSNLGKGASS